MSSPSFVACLRSSALGPVEEARHRVHLVLSDAQGRLIASSGDTERSLPARSAFKPFQALHLVASPAFTRFELGPEELALACGSHTGAISHTTLGERWLSRLGLNAESLLCGHEAPRDAEASLLMERARYRPEEGYSDRPTPLHHRCSGEHLGLLSSALAFGLDPRVYLHAKGPAQQQIRRLLESLLPSEVERSWAIDDCCAPTPILSLHELAQLYAMLVEPPAGEWREALTQVASAMMAHPELQGGRGILDTRVMRTVAGLCLRQSEHGLLTLACVHPTYGPLGGAIWVEDGAELALGPMLMALLSQLELLKPAARYALKDLERPERKNGRGLTVGAYQAELRLSFQPGASHVT